MIRQREPIVIFVPTVRKDIWIPMRERCVMGWATRHIENLKAGKTVVFKPRGDSMTGRIESGQTCTVSPDISELWVDDIVLCKVAGREYLHLILDIEFNWDKSKALVYKIGNNKGYVNGFIGRELIFGKLIDIK